AIAALVIWEVLVDLLEVQTYVLPPPSSIFDGLVALLQSASFWRHFRVTMFEAAAGYALGCVVAFGLGILIAQSRLLRRLLFPFIVGFEMVPKVAFAPILLIWFGFGLTPKVLLVALVCFFPMLVNVIEGLSVNHPM